MKNRPDITRPVNPGYDFTDFMAGIYIFPAMSPWSISCDVQLFRTCVSYYRKHLRRWPWTIEDDEENSWRHLGFPSVTTIAGWRG